MLECVVNVSEGRDPTVVGAVAEAAGDALLDVHRDPHHNRSVLTLAGPDVEGAARAVARVALGLIDLRRHEGVHPRLGVVDVVPFVPLAPGGAPVCGDGDLTAALAARDAFAAWAGEELGLPCFTYGPERTLPEVRRGAFTHLVPDTGPTRPHPAAGACAVGARFALVAYNLWLATSDMAVTRAIAAALRGPAVRTLALDVGGVGQVSCNLVDPLRFGPAEAFDAVTRLAQEAGTSVARAELVGLVPAAVVTAVARADRGRLDLDAERTVESRLTHPGAP